MPKLTTEQWIEKAREVHGDKYDYSKVEYVNQGGKVTIFCNVHGHFEQNAGNHITKKNPRGCRMCGISERSDSLADFTNKGVSVWGERYRYVSQFKECGKKYIEALCLEHDHLFRQRADGHLGGKQGCQYCSSRTRGAGMVYLIEIHVPETEEKFIKIGWTTSNVRTRFRLEEFEWKQLNRKMFPNAFLGERWERYMHKMFDDCRYKPKHKFYGATECFGYQYKELIQKTFAEEAKRGN